MKKENILEAFLLIVVVASLAAIPLTIWYYEEVYIPSQYGDDAKVIRLYVNLKGWTTERIAAFNYWWKKFKPAEITVQKGETIILRITSVDVYHGFGIKMPGLRINEKVKPGQLTTVRFNADKEGSYGFRCTLECGKDHSDMAANLLVEQSGAITYRSGGE